MRRRHFVAVAGLAAIAGCAGSDDEDPDTENTSAETEQNQEKNNEQEQETENTSAETEQNQEKNNEREQETDDEQAEFEVQNYEIPESGKVGEPVEIVITFENIGNGDGTLTELAQIVHSQAGEINFDNFPEIDLEVPAGETATWDHSFVPEKAGKVSFTYDNVEQDILIDPESKAPQIQRVELITGWNSFGDVLDNAIESTTVGSNVAIGIRYDYWHEDGTHSITAEVEIYDGNGDLFDVLQARADRLSEVEGWDEWERYIPFTTDGASTGEYEATAQIRDDDSMETSEAVSTVFTIEE